jgi:hypothetical protein
MGGDELFQKQPAEQPREHAHRQEEARPAGYPPLAVQGNAPARNDHVDVRVVGERRSPGVQHGGHADPRAQVFGIGRDRDHRLGGGLEQKVVNHGLVLIGDVADRRRQREDHMVIWGGQQLGLALGQPSPRRRALALRAMPIAAAIIGDIDEVPHPFRREFFAIDVRRERRAVRELSRPMQDLLTCVLHPRCCPCDRNSQFVPARLELGLLRSLPHLRYDIREFLVGSRKRQRAFCLDFEDRVGAVGVRGLDDHIVKRTARTALLEFNSSDGRPRQAARFAAGKQR